MKTTTRILMCLLLMGLFTATTGCDDVLSSELGGTSGTYDEGWGTYDEGWGGGWDSGTIFGRDGDSISWW